MSIQLSTQTGTLRAPSRYSVFFFTYPWFKSSMHQGPTLYLIGGPNGAGKTTFAKEYLPNEVQCLRFYNSDEIAAGLSPLNPAAAQIQAARILLKNLSQSITKRETYVPLSNHWLLWDASQSPPEIIAEKGTHDIVELIQ